MREERDPIDHLRESLMEAKILDEDGAKAIDKAVREIVNASAEFAQNSPEPDPSELYTDVLTEAAA